MAKSKNVHSFSIKTTPTRKPPTVAQYTSEILEYYPKATPEEKQLIMECLAEVVAAVKPKK